MNLVSRLNFRQNWPLLAAGVALLIAWIGSQYVIKWQPGYYASQDPTSHQYINYPKLISEYSPSYYELLVTVALIAGIVLILRFARHRRILAIMAGIGMIVANCLWGYAWANAFFRDGIVLWHQETIQFNGNIYQLAHAVGSASGLDVAIDDYYVYKCDSAGIECKYLDHSLESFIADSAHFVIDTKDNSLYLQYVPFFGDRKILIAQN